MCVEAVCGGQNPNLLEALASQRDQSVCGSLSPCSPRSRQVKDSSARSLYGRCRKSGGLGERHREGSSHCYL